MIMLCFLLLESFDIFSLVLKIKEQRRLGILIDNFSSALTKKRKKLNSPWHSPLYWDSPTHRHRIFPYGSDQSSMIVTAVPVWELVSSYQSIFLTHCWNLYGYFSFRFFDFVYFLVTKVTPRQLKRLAAVNSSIDWNSRPNANNVSPQIPNILIGSMLVKSSWSQSVDLLIREGPLEITGGGVTIPPKKIPARETCLKKSCKRWYLKKISHMP